MFGYISVPAVKPGRTKKFTSQWRGPYTVIDKLSDTNYRIQLVGSSAKSLVVHHNRMKLCYGIPQQVPSPLPPLATPEFQDIPRLSNAHPVGGYTTSSTTPPSRGTRPHRSCGPPSHYQDFINLSQLVRTQDPGWKLCNSIISMHTHDDSRMRCNN